MSKRHNEIDKQVIENAKADPIARLKAVTEIADNLAEIITRTHAMLNGIGGAFQKEDAVAGRYKIILLRKMRDKLHKESLSIMEEMLVTRPKVKEIE